MTKTGQVRSTVSLVWCTATVSLGLFLVLAVAVSQGTTTGLDSSILTWFRNAAGDVKGPLWLRESLLEITALGGYPVIVLAIVLGVSGLYYSGKTTAALFLAASVGGGSVLSTALKLVFDRSRPDLVVHLDQIYTSSFPSAHAMVSMVAWLTLALVFTRYVRSDRLRKFLIASAVLLSLLIGFSRVYLGVHWPTDVIAGWLVGIAWACASWLCAHYLSRNKRVIGQYGKST